MDSAAFVYSFCVSSSVSKRIYRGTVTKLYNIQSCTKCVLPAQREGFADLDMITWKKASVGIYDIFLLLHGLLYNSDPNTKKKRFNKTRNYSRNLQYRGFLRLCDFWISSMPHIFLWSFPVRLVRYSSFARKRQKFWLSRILLNFKGIHMQIHTW